jgi:hypothetical protein
MYINISLGKQYGLLLSGGLSSSLLLYLMMKDRPTARVQPFTISNASENSILYANPIIDYFNSKFGWTIPHTIKVGNDLLPEDQLYDSSLLFILKKHTDIVELFNGSNNSPDGPPPIPSRRKIKKPFLFFTKDKVLELIYNEGLDDIIDLTHSCTTQSVGRCGHCRNCTVRSWAFSTVGKFDTGTN